MAQYNWVSLTERRLSFGGSNFSYWWYWYSIGPYELVDMARFFITVQYTIWPSELEKVLISFIKTVPNPLCQTVFSRSFQNRFAGFKWKWQMRQCSYRQRCQRRLRCHYLSLDKRDCFLVLSLMTIYKRKLKIAFS